LWHFNFISAQALTPAPGKVDSCINVGDFFKTIHQIQLLTINVPDEIMQQALTPAPGPAFN
jgi:hypothetical protein